MYPLLSQLTTTTGNSSTEAQDRQIMFGMAGETEFDVRFHVFGVPVRIHPMFWLTSAFLVRDGRSPQFMFLGIICVLLSVLVHELGHALLSRRFGFPSEIVLYAFGGYATGWRFSTWRNVAVSAAGPGAGFLLYAVTRVIILLLPRQVDGLLSIGPGVQYCLGILLFVNFFWSVLNLMPCLPLDGGQIMQALVYRYLPRRAPERVLQISIVVSGGIVLLAMQYAPGQSMLMIMFGLLCAQSVIAYNNLRTFH